MGTVDVTENKINVGEIMAEIRRDIKEKGYKNEAPPFSDTPIHLLFCEMAHSGALEENLKILRVHSNVAAYRPLKSNNALGPVFGAMIVFVKRVIRKLTLFFVAPIVADQNENNRVSVSCLQDLYLDMNAMRLRIQALEEENMRIKKELETNRGN